MMNEIPLDFFGFPLKVGDKVGFSSDSNMLSGIIVETREFWVTVRLAALGTTEDMPANNVIKYLCSPDDLKLLKFATGAEQ
jgi:hypothetical protein